MAKNWYFEINDYCNTLSEVHNVPLIKVAGIMSALSPNNTVRLNCISLEKFLKHNGNCKVTTFNGQKIKALTILNADDSITVEEVKEILSPKKDSGLKTKAFFDNIYRPETSTEVTIDLWMIRWAKIEGSLTPKRYRDTANKIIEMAKELNVLPHMLQAKIWVDIRGEAY
tara:strand:+ start:40576 stop:41085 length:510 start_codon:yes stop_codon:yes gene_type:complete